MTARRHTRKRLPAEREQERFSTDGKGFVESLKRVLAGGPDDGRHEPARKADDEREASG